MYSWRNGSRDTVRSSSSPISQSCFPRYVSSSLGYCLLFPKPCRCTRLIHPRSRRSYDGCALHDRTDRLTSPCSCSGISPNRRQPAQIHPSTNPDLSTPTARRLRSTHRLPRTPNARRRYKLLGGHHSRWLTIDTSLQCTRGRVCWWMGLRRR